MEIEQTHTASLSQEKTYSYLDFAASAPPRKEAIELYRSYLERAWGYANPSSVHSLGRGAQRHLDEARRLLAGVLQADFKAPDIIFTSGGTESNNLAILGLSKAQRKLHPKKNRVLISTTEHDSIKNLASPLKKLGFLVEEIPVDEDGFIDEAAYQELLGDDVCLVSILYANNETGRLQPIEHLTEMAHKVGSLFHTDAVQGFCHVPLALAGVDAVSFTAHKCGALIGVGALALRRSLTIEPLCYGGGQERGVRPGTQSVALAWTFAQVAAELSKKLPDVQRALFERSELLLERLVSSCPQIESTLHSRTLANALPSTLNILVKQHSSESLILQLDEAGFEVSSAAACSSQGASVSHVLLAMKRPFIQAQGSLRISFDERVSLETLMRFSDALSKIVHNDKN